MSQMPEMLLKNWNVRNVTDAREDFEKNGMSEMSQMPEDFEKKWNVRNVRNVNEDFEKFRVLCQKCHRCQGGFRKNGMSEMSQLSVRILKKWNVRTVSEDFEKIKFCGVRNVRDDRESRRKILEE